MKIKFSLVITSKEDKCVGEPVTTHYFEMSCTVMDSGNYPTNRILNGAGFGEQGNSFQLFPQEKYGKLVKHTEPFHPVKSSEVFFIGRAKYSTLELAKQAQQVAEVRIQEWLHKWREDVKIDDFIGWNELEI